MKKCMLCGTLESDDERKTCRACGEATWKQSFEYAPEPNGPAEMTVEVVPPPRRGPGRPRKTQ